MNISIAYFSPTGNCRDLAEYLFSGMNTQEAGIQNITTPEGREDFSLPESYLVVVTPVYAQDLPDLVRDFLSALQGSGQYATLLTVDGGIHKGRALNAGVRLLSKQGLRPVSAGCFTGSHSYSSGKHPFGLPGMKERQRELAWKVVQRTRLLVKIGLMENQPLELPLALKNPLAYLPQKWLSHMAVKKPSHDGTACRGCGKCLAGCPTGTIMRDYTLENMACIRCMACVRNCPERAWEAAVNPISLTYLRAASKKPKEPKTYLLEAPGA